MSFLDNFRAKEFKQELEELKQKYQKLRARITSSEALIAMDILDLKEKKQELQQQVEELEKEYASKQTALIQLDDDILLQSFGIYKTRYDLEDAKAYKSRLDDIRDEQKRMIKINTAVISGTTWQVSGSEAEGRRMVKDYVKLILRSFNNECDATIIKAKYNNVESLEKKIIKAAEALNKLGTRMNISISERYINLKLQELYLAYEYELKKQAEKEEQRMIKEQMREEAKARKELEDAKKKLKKEAKHFKQALAAFDEQLERAETDSERHLIEAEKQKAQAQLAKVNEDIASNELKEKNTRAGHVYVISNIGSFGEDVYKIGMTKRLDPLDRVYELGDASVPYRFDVHAMIFSEDAPSLENAIHREFANRRLNMINQRREFFRVSLDEIEQVVRENFSKPVEITRVAQADEYRQSEKMRQALQEQARLS